MAEAERLLREVLKLAPEDRASVAAELLASLEDSSEDHPDEVEAAWAVEIERRARRVLAGESRGRSWDEVRSHAEDDLRRR